MLQARCLRDSVPLVMRLTMWYQYAMILRAWALLAITVAFCIDFISAQEVRTWTDATGKHKFQGSFLSINEGKVTLQNKAGKVVKLALEKLSEVDQKAALELGLKGYWGLDFEKYLVAFTKYAEKRGAVVDENFRESFRESAKATVMNFDGSGKAAINSHELGKVISATYKVDKPQDDANSFTLTINLPDSEPRVINARIDADKLRYFFPKGDSPDSTFTRITKNEFDKRKAAGKRE